MSIFIIIGGEVRCAGRIAWPMHFFSKMWSRAHTHSTRPKMYILFVFIADGARMRAGKRRSESWGYLRQSEKTGSYRSQPSVVALTSGRSHSLSFLLLFLCIAWDGRWLPWMAPHHPFCVPRRLKDPLRGPKSTFVEAKAETFSKTGQIQRRLAWGL